MSQTDTKNVFLLPKTVKKVGTKNALSVINMWYNHKTIRYSYEPSDKELILSFELPGKSKEDVKIMAYESKNSINVKVANKDSFEVDLDDYSYYNNGENYSLSEMKAKMEHGLLTVTVPKKAEKHKLIEIS